MSEETQVSDGARYYEDFTVGEVIQHPIGRTVTTTDNIWFTNLTMNPNPIHFDHYYASQTEFGQPLVNSAFTLSLVTGLSVADLSARAFANLGWDEVKLPRPVFEGDTLYAQSEVLEARGVAVAAERGDCAGEDHRVQPGWEGRDRVQTEHHGVPSRAGAEDSAASGGLRGCRGAAPLWTPAIWGFAALMARTIPLAPFLRGRGK